MDIKDVVNYVLISLLISLEIDATKRIRYGQNAEKIN